MNKTPRLAVTIVAMSLMSAAAPAADPSLRFQVPSTVSPEARKQLDFIYALRARLPKATRPVTLAQWDAQRAGVEKRFVPLGQGLADRLHVTVTEDRIAGIPVLRVRPAGYKPDSRVLIYLHGGGYTSFSARSSLSNPSLVATATGNQVISIDYTLAPRANWMVITDEVLAVWRAMLAKGAVPQMSAFWAIRPAAAWRPAPC